ncbi:hypothetical protein ES707_22743 [subsurface metagenome]
MGLRSSLIMFSAIFISSLSTSVFFSMFASICFNPNILHARNLLSPAMISYLFFTFFIVIAFIKPTSLIEPASSSIPPASMLSLILFLGWSIKFIFTGSLIL